MLERSYLDSVGARLGQPLLIETSSGRQFQVPLSGLAHDLTAVSARLGSVIVFGYASLDTAEWLGLSHDMNNLEIIVGGDELDILRKLKQAGTILHDTQLIVYPSSRRAWYGFFNYDWRFGIFGYGLGYLLSRKFKRIVIPYTPVR